MNDTLQDALRAGLNKAAQSIDHNRVQRAADQFINELPDGAREIPADLPQFDDPELERAVVRLLDQRGFDLRRDVPPPSTKNAQAPPVSEQFQLERDSMIPGATTQSDTAAFIEDVARPRATGRPNPMADFTSAAYHELFSDANLDQIGETLQENAFAEGQDPHEYYSGAYEQASSAGDSFGEALQKGKDQIEGTAQDALNKLQNYFSE